MFQTFTLYKIHEDLHKCTVHKQL